MEFDQHTLSATYRTWKRQGRKIAALTAYDYPMGRLLDEAGVDFILVGDSLGMVVLGYRDTTSVTMPDMEHHTRAVRRGVKSAVLVADLPFESYETPEMALENARRLLEAGADAVKLEGGVPEREMIATLVTAGIPVVGHIGMLPQHIREEGGYKIKGKTVSEAEALMADALAVQEAGAFAVVLEIITPGVAKAISQTLEIPTIGIGSSSDCDGQILVTHDLVGMFPWFVPKFVTPRASVAGAIREACEAYVRDLRGS